MKKVIYAIVLYILFGCTSAPVVPTTEVVEDMPISILKQMEILYTMTITNNGFYGKSFIADSKLYTCEHMFSETPIDLLISDIRVLGDSSIAGLCICTEEHGPGDFFYSILQGGFSVFCVFEVIGNYYDTSSSPNVITGDSGTPVLCIEHNGVVGLVSAIGYTRHNQSWVGRINNGL